MPVSDKQEKVQYCARKEVKKGLKSAMVLCNLISNWCSPIRARKLSKDADVWHRFNKADEVTGPDLWLPSSDKARTAVALETVLRT